MLYHVKCPLNLSSFIGQGHPNKLGSWLAQGGTGATFVQFIGALTAVFENELSVQLWPWLPVITGDFYGIMIIHSINGVTC